MNENNTENEFLEEQAENSVLDTNENTVTDVEKMSDEAFDEYLAKTRTGGDGEMEAESAQPDKSSDDESDTAEADDKPAEGEDTKEETKPFKSFSTEEDFLREVEAAVSERMQKSAVELERLSGLARQASAFYDTENEDEALEQLLEDLRTQNADKQGVDIEAYNRAQKDAEDARLYRKQQEEAREREIRINGIRSRWDRESAELKSIVPNFDFSKAMENKEFYNRLVNGSSVSAAYIGSGLAAPKTAPAAKKESARRVIRQNGSANDGHGAVSVNPTTMTDAEFEDYISKIKNGRC